ncbi:hypothetical protein QAD02_009992 [Eretmocerus hayati]|uniref:Uncharacterized protein n=1 Tax=Eretmocerus hayati TaxID=131215 RepID=A0ACC2ND99_9HYME|nr:hypothetical protein QAD02_009992 [Eretmocerus hayati]
MDLDDFDQFLSSLRSNKNPQDDRPGIDSSSSAFDYSSTNPSSDTITSPRLIISTPSPARSPGIEDSHQQLSHLSFHQHQQYQRPPSSDGSFQSAFSSCSSGIVEPSYVSSSIVPITDGEPYNYTFAAEAVPGDEPPTAASLSRLSESDSPQHPRQNNDPAAVSNIDSSIEQQQKEYHIMQPPVSTLITSPINENQSNTTVSSLLTNTIVEESRLPVARSTPNRQLPHQAFGSVALHNFYESFVSSELLTGDTENRQQQQPQIVELEVVDTPIDDVAIIEEFQPEVVQSLTVVDEQVVEHIDKGDQASEDVEIRQEKEEEIEVVEQQASSSNGIGVASVMEPTTSATTSKASKITQTRRDREHRVLKGRVSRPGFKCVICGKPYRQKRLVRKHLSSHVIEMCDNSQGPGASIKCSVCHRNFVSKGGLTSHLRSHIAEASSDESD